MSSTRLKKGDIIELPLLNNKKGYIQYISPDIWGDIVGIYNLVLDKDKVINLDEYKNIDFKYYPILTRVKVGLKLEYSLSQIDKIQNSPIVVSETFLKMALMKESNFNWKVIGNIPIQNFTYPNFIWKDGGILAKDRVTKWYLFDGKNNIELGKRLPKEYKHLEYQVNYSPDSIVDLIMGNKVEVRDVNLQMIGKG